MLAAANIAKHAKALSDDGGGSPRGGVSWHVRVRDAAFVDSVFDAAAQAGAVASNGG